EDVSPHEYLEYLQILEKRLQENLENEELAEKLQQQRELANGYDKLNQMMIQKGKVDFGDQVLLPLQLLRQHANILHEFQQKFKYILIDEFQDTNYAQFQLVKLLAGERANITVVADDDQSIYKFRGAAISNILNFKKDYPEANLVVLIQNYRSTQAILDVAYKLIVHNNPDRLEIEHNIDKKLKAQESEGKPVSHLHYDTITSEADAVANIIADKVNTQKFNYNDFAILVRANNDADPFIRSLNIKGIPFRFTGNRGLYNRQEVRLLMSFLYVIADLDNSLQLYQLATSEVYRIPMKDITYCMNLADRKNISLYTIFKHREEKSSELPYLSNEGKATIDKIIVDLDRYLEISRDNPTGVVLYRFLTDTNYLHRLIDEDADYKIQNIARFFEVVRNFSNLAVLDRVYNFVEHLELLIEAGDDPATAEADLDAKAVNILTIHKAKGLEFPIIFLVSLVNDKFPTRNRGDAIPLPDELVKDVLPTGDFHIQEERRLFYVGMTRAKRELYLTSARDYGGKRPRKVSPFVLEALDKPRADEDYLKTSALEAIKRFAPLDDSSEERPGMIPQDKIITLSHFHVDDYLTCPLKYKFIHILRVPLLPHHTIVYGRAIHEAIKEYHLSKINGKEITVERLIEVFHKSWISEGFLSREHEQKRLHAGEKTLRKFYEDQESSPFQPTYVEKDFSVLIDNDRIVGRWDRVDIRNGEVIVVDFKSSEVRQQKDADRRVKESLQLPIYALAYQQIYEQTPTTIELHFLETNLIGRALVTDKILNKALENIKEAADGIRSRDYTPKPSYMNCRYCAYSEVCPATLKKF
ncbi:MAG: PD-(D/E)XK nuclease family protein, partial [bacterium]